MNNILDGKWECIIETSDGQKMIFTLEINKGSVVYYYDYENQRDREKICSNKGIIITIDTNTNTVTIKWEIDPVETSYKYSLSPNKNTLKIEPTCSLINIGGKTYNKKP